MKAGDAAAKGPPNEEGAVEIGYAIVPKLRRRGYAREAIDAMCGWAFEDSQVARVIAHTLRDLAPSIGVLTSAGFTKVGPDVDVGEPDAVLYDLTRAEYDNSRQQRARFVVMAV